MSFNPPAGLRNPHIQTIFSSVGPRRLKVRSSFRPYRAGEQAVILDCGDGVRLAGYFNQAGSGKSDQLAILMHGWEGSHESSYMLSMTTTLLRAGIDVFRLNMRDHGDTHHLNEQVFNSTMVDEVISGIADLQARFNYAEYVLGGFSLGGNFGCRVAAMGHDAPISLSKVAAFCPVLHAGESNAVLNARENALYGQYFVRKWKKSLRKKLEYFPHYEFHDELSELKTLEQMNRRLVPKYTPYRNVDEYFSAYAITGDRMAHTICPVYLHFSQDDMMIPYQGIEKLAHNPDLHITLTRHGGHCGFLMNWRLDSWQDQRMLELIRS